MLNHLKSLVQKIPDIKITRRLEWRREHECKTGCQSAITSTQSTSGAVLILCYQGLKTWGFAYTIFTVNRYSSGEAASHQNKPLCCLFNKVGKKVHLNVHRSQNPQCSQGSADQIRIKTLSLHCWLVMLPVHHRVENKCREDRWRLTCTNMPMMGQSKLKTETNRMENLLYLTFKLNNYYLNTPSLMPVMWAWLKYKASTDVPAAVPLMATWG